MFKVLQQISLAGGMNNIDLIRTSENCILLLDGSTPLVDSAYDASHFVVDFADAFFSKVNGGMDIRDAISSALDDVYKLFKNETENDNVDMYPSACLLVAYESGDSLNIINIGDSVAIIVMKDGSIKTISCNDVPYFDGKVIERAKSIRASTGSDFCDIINLPEIKQMLIDNRAKMNSTNGYRILTFGMPCVNDSDIQSFPKDEIERIVLYSDGFDGYEDMLTDADADLDTIYRALRDKENSDPKLNQYPRFKLSDDASAIIFEIK